MGSVTLPEEIELSCPQCGTLAADKGDCIVSLTVRHNEESKTGLSVYIHCDCRVCGCDGEALAIESH